MNLTLSLLGRAVLVIDFDHGRAAAPPTPSALVAAAPPAPAEECSDVRPPAGPFGFGGGSGGSQERAWHPPADRPLNAE